MYGFESFYFYFLLAYAMYAFAIKVVCKGKYRKQYALFLMIPLFMLSSLRGDTVGGDLENYLPRFYEMCFADDFGAAMEVDGHDVGYKILLWVITRISNSTRFFLIATSLLSLIGPMLLIKRYSSSILASFLMYYSMGFYTNTFNNIRQSIAASLFFLAFPFLIKRKITNYFLIVLVAALIHHSAVVLFLVYPLTIGLLSLKKIFSIIGGGVALFVVMGSSLLYNIIMLFFMKYDPEQILNETEGAGWNLFILYSFISLVLIVFYYSQRNRLDVSKNQILSLLLTCQILALLFQLFATIFPSMTRMGQYFFIPIIITIPLLISYTKNKFYSYSLVLFTISYCALLFYLTYSYSPTTGSNSQGVIPYVFLNK